LFNKEIFMPKRKNPGNPFEFPNPNKEPEINPIPVPEEPKIVPEEDPDAIPDEEPDETPPYEVPPPGEGP
jgi:hypothetical protein